MLLINARHQSSGRRKDFIDEDEDGLLRGELNALANDIDELPDGEICWYQILLLINSGDI